jgi:2-octaprenyl-3-methyl-6-methoxy-1,4-benzoquinol hydroxylase
VFDICVVGGGMVGSAVGLGLGKMGFSVAIIEPNMPETFEPNQPPDLRVSAISLTSEKLLEGLGAWTHIENMRLCPYKRLSVWDTPACRTDFNSDSIKQTHLGHIIENRLVQLGLLQELSEYKNIRLIKNLKITEYDMDNGGELTLEDGQIIQAKIIIGADGGNSTVRGAAKIGVQGWQYSHQALGIQIKTKSSQQDITWQQFTATGPIAFLPLYDGYASLVWYHQASQIHYLKNLSKDQLKQQIVQAFPKELVDFEVLGTASFPLTRMHANQYSKDNVLLVGDAAHTINPLAGQGVNLGFKDVAALLAVVQDELASHDRSQVLAQDSYKVWFQTYEKQRRRDNLLMMSAMDLLHSSFSNSNTPIKLLRNLGLKLANHAGPIKNSAMKYAMGL